MAKKSDKPIRGMSYVTKNGVRLYWSEQLGRYVSVPEKGNGEFPRVIGSVTTYVGSDKRFSGQQYRMMIIGIFRRDCSPDSDNYYIKENQRLAELDGVRPTDGAEVHVWNDADDRWGIVGEEIDTVTELECFAHLASATEAERGEK